MSGTKWNRDQADFCHQCKGLSLRMRCFVEFLWIASKWFVIQILALSCIPVIQCK